MFFNSQKTRDEHFMKYALSEAKIAFREGEIN